MAALTSSHCRRVPSRAANPHSAAQEAYDAPMATTPRMKITYATLSADNEELQSSFDAALARARADLGRTYPMIIGSEERLGDETFEDRSPIDRDLLIARFPKGTRQDVRDAIDAARAASPAWRDTPWRDRLAILRRAAELISERQFDYAALMALEVGKNRLEALGDVEETADLLRYYSDEFEKADGFVKPLGSLSSAEKTRSVLRPYGVFGVISPFNFPMALSGRPGRRRDDRRQHRRAEALVGRSTPRLEVRRGSPRRRPA